MTVLPRQILLFIFCCLTGALLSAQQVKQFSFTRYNTSTGLVSNQVNSVVQDATGYIWTGTTDGLQRYDGTRYKTFRHNRFDSLTIPSNPVLQLLIDKKQNLWVLLADGKVGIFHTYKHTFHEASIRFDDPAAVFSFKKLICDEEGNLFLLLKGHTLLRWNETKNTFSAADNFILIPPGKKIADMARQPGTRKYWLSLIGGGLAIYDHATGKLSDENHNTGAETAIDLLNKKMIASQIFFDSKGRLWFDTWGEGFPYLFCYDTRINRLLLDKYHFLDHVKTYYEIHGFFEQQDGTIWARGLKIFARYLEKENTFQLVYNGYLNERGISYDEIHCFAEDRENNIWVGTGTQGLYRFNPSQDYFRNISHINRRSRVQGDGSVLAFARTRNDHILVATWGDGLYRYDRDFNLLPTNIRGIDNTGGPSIWCMVASRDSHTIWMAAQPGIYRYDQRQEAVQFYNPPDLQNKTVRQVAEDHSGNLWFGIQGGGLFKWNADNGKNHFNAGVRKMDFIPKAQVNKLMVDKKGLVWVGTSSEGLFLADPGAEKVLAHFGKNEAPGRKITENAISSVLDYNDSLVIITTSSTLHMYNRQKYTMADIGYPGTISGYITAVEKDAAGYLWLSTTNGLYRVNIFKKVFVRFLRTDGIDNDNFILASSGRLPGGNLLFGSSNQFIYFNPLQIQIQKTPQKVAITDFRVMNRSLRIDSLLSLEKIWLGPHSNSIVVDFSTLNYSSPYMIRYKLEGLDKDWKLADAANQAVYSYLPAGHFTLLLGTLDEDARPGKDILSLPIRVRPAFWNTWWFYSLLLLFAASLFYWFDRERMSRKEALEKMRTDISDNLHEKVSTALNNINILSEMARLKADRDPQKSKEYIEQIHTRSSNMIIAMDDMLWSINHENDNMKKTIDRMKEYIDALNNRHGAGIDILVDKKLESLKLNMKTRYEAFLTFKEGIQNLLVAGATHCRVHLGLEKSKILFTAQFDNRKINMQELNNLLHRPDLEKRLESLGARIQIQVHKTSSTISLQVPVG